MMDNEDLRTAQGAYDDEPPCRTCREVASQCRCRPEMLSSHNTESRTL